MQLTGDTHYTKAIREWNYKFHIVPEMSPLRAALIDEEVEELTKAIETKNTLEIIDGLCDVIYVAAGTQVARGLVFEANIIDVFSTPGLGEDTLALLREVDAEYALNTPQADMFLACLIRHCEFIAQLYNIDLVRNFDIVHANNMAKVWTQEQAITTDMDSREVTIVDSDTCIVKNLAGKVIKPPGHPKPVLILPV